MSLRFTARLALVALIVVLASAGLRAAGLGGSTGGHAAPSVAASDDLYGPTQRAVVTSVVDGDTVRVRAVEPGALAQGQTTRLRLPALDAPETRNPARPVGCGGPEASAFVTDLLEGETVTLERDRKDRDPFDRAIRYVRLDDGRLADEVIVAEGHARARLYDADDRYYPILVAAEAEARAAGRGLWGHCADGAGGRPATLAPSPPVAPQGLPNGGGQGCDPAYPDACIPPAPPNLDCGSPGVGRDLTALSPDPHHLDGDGDGVGCES